VLCYDGWIICTLTVGHFLKQDGKCYVMLWWICTLTNGFGFSGHVVVYL
jgi:hypothetical protein